MRQSEESAGSHSEPTLRAGDADRWRTNAVLRSSIRAVRYIGTLPRRHPNLWVLLGQDGGPSTEHGAYLNGCVYLYYIGIQTVDPTSIWGFRNVGSGLARFDPATGECERLLVRGGWRMWRPLGLDMHFGVQVVRDGEFCYVFGSVRHGLFSQAILARVRPDDIADLDAYTYLKSTEPEWSDSLDDACDLG